MSERIDQELLIRYVTKHPWLTTVQLSYRLYWSRQALNYILPRLAEEGRVTVMEEQGAPGVNRFRRLWAGPGMSKGTGGQDEGTGADQVMLRGSRATQPLSPQMPGHG